MQGGAAEFYWTIRTTEGGSCTCQTAEIASIQLLATRCDTLTAEGVCVGATEPTLNTGIWKCVNSRGTTLFDIPEGRWAFTIKAFTPNGLPATSTVLPPPIVRDVVTGEVAMLDALQITKTTTCNTP